MTSPAGLTKAANALTPAAGSGHVLEHFHASHQIEGGGRSLRQLFQGNQRYSTATLLSSRV